MSYTGEYVAQPFGGLGDAAQRRGMRSRIAHMRKLEQAIRHHTREAEEAGVKARKYATIAAGHRARAAALAAQLARLAAATQAGAPSAYVGQRRAPVRHARRF